MATVTPPTLTTLALAKLTLDPRLQPRKRMDEDVLREYVDAMHRRRETFPPIRVIADKDHHWLVDGWHRVKAATYLKRIELSAEVSAGTFEDAEDFVLTVNRTHGVRRTHADVQNAIQRALKTQRWVKRADNWIAKQIGCDQKTVTTQREQLESTSEIPKLKKLVGEDGKARMRPTPKPKPAPTKEAIDDPLIERRSIGVSSTSASAPSPLPKNKETQSLDPARLLAVHAFHGCCLSDGGIADVLGLSPQQVNDALETSRGEYLTNSEAVTEAQSVIQLAISQGASVVDVELARDWLIKETDPQYLEHRNTRRLLSKIVQSVSNWTEDAQCLPVPPRPDDWTPYASERTEILAAIPVIETYLAALKASVGTIDVQPLKVKVVGR